jgi:hypothetical protein
MTGKPRISQTTGGLLCNSCYRIEKYVIKRQSNKSVSTSHKESGSSRRFQFTDEPQTQSITIIPTEFNTPFE